MAITVDNPFDYVFKKWGETMVNVVGEGNYSMDKSSQIAKTPYARMFMMGNPGMGFDLEGDELSTSLSFQVESFESGNKSTTKAYRIDDESHKLMTSLGFRRTYGPELIDNADSKIKRVVSRYNRIYTGKF